MLIFHQNQNESRVQDTLDPEELIPIVVFTGKKSNVLPAHLLIDFHVSK